MKLFGKKWDDFFLPLFFYLFEFIWNRFESHCIALHESIQPLIRTTNTMVCSLLYRSAFAQSNIHVNVLGLNVLFFHSLHTTGVHSLTLFIFFFAVTSHFLSIQAQSFSIFHLLCCEFIHFLCAVRPFLSAFSMRMYYGILEPLERGWKLENFINWIEVKAKK